MIAPTLTPQIVALAKTTETMRALLESMLETVMFSCDVSVPPTELVVVSLMDSSSSEPAAAKVEAPTRDTATGT